MDMLHLVPAALLCTIGFWLLWPVVVDPIARRARAGRVRRLGATDSLAETLFEDWAHQSHLNGRKESEQG